MWWVACFFFLITGPFITNTTVVGDYTSERFINWKILLTYTFWFYRWTIPKNCVFKICVKSVNKKIVSIYSPYTKLCISVLFFFSFFKTYNLRDLNFNNVFPMGEGLLSIKTTYFLMVKTKTRNKTFHRIKTKQKRNKELQCICTKRS